MLIPYRIYRGKDPDLIEIPIPKTEDKLDKMDSFFARLKWGAYVGWFAGTTYSLQDIAYHSRLTDRRAQLVRYVFFTTPAVLSGIAWIAGLEIAKKYNDSRMGAYALAAIPPAGVLATWRRDPKWFPKTLVPIALAGVTYAWMVQDNQYFGPWGGNPNDPSGKAASGNMFMNWPHKAHLGPKMEIFLPKDPGPTYAKWEDTK